MEGLTTRLYKGVKDYCRTRGYQRLPTTILHTAGQQQQQQQEEEREEGEESAGSRRRRWRRRRRRSFWKFRINSSRLTLKLKPTVRKLFIGLRDGYVRIMMKLSNSSVVMRSRPMSCAGGQGGSGQGFGTLMALKECDEKMIMEIYKTLAMRQTQLLAQPIPQSQIHISSSV